MRKYYYVCPRCGRCYKRFIPRRKTKCGFCSTVWKTRGAKGTRSSFSWTATLALFLAIIALAFFAGREFGVFSKSPKLAEEPHSWGTGFDSSTESVEDWGSAIVEDAPNGEIVETSEQIETHETSEDAAE